MLVSSILKMVPRLKSFGLDACLSTVVKSSGTNPAKSTGLISLAKLNKLSEVTGVNPLTLATLVSLKLATSYPQITINPHSHSLQTMLTIRNLRVTIPTVALLLRIAVPLWITVLAMAHAAGMDNASAKLDGRVQTAH